MENGAVQREPSETVAEVIDSAEDATSTNHLRKEEPLASVENVFGEKNLPLTEEEFTSVAYDPAGGVAETDLTKEHPKEEDEADKTLSESMDQQPEGLVYENEKLGDFQEANEVGKPELIRKEEDDHDTLLVDVHKTPLPETDSGLPTPEGAVDTIEPEIDGQTTLTNESNNHMANEIDYKPEPADKSDSMDPKTGTGERSYDDSMTHDTPSSTMSATLTAATAHKGQFKEESVAHEVVAATAVKSDENMESASDDSAIGQTYSSTDTPEAPLLQDDKHLDTFAHEEFNEEDGVAVEKASTIEVAQPSSVEGDAHLEPAMAHEGLLKRENVTDASLPTMDSVEPTAVVSDEDVEPAATSKELSKDETLVALKAESVEPSNAKRDTTLETATADQMLFKVDSSADDLGSDSTAVELAPVDEELSKESMGNETGLITESAESKAGKDDSMSDEDLIEQESDKGERASTTETAESKAGKDDSMSDEDLIEQESDKGERASITETAQPSAVENGPSAVRDGNDIESAKADEGIEPTALETNPSANWDDKDVGPARAAEDFMKERNKDYEIASTADAPEAVAVVSDKIVEPAPVEEELSKEESGLASHLESSDPTSGKDHEDLEPATAERSLSTEDSVVYNLVSDSTTVDSDGGVEPVTETEDVSQEESVVDQAASTIESSEPSALQGAKEVEGAAVDEELSKEEGVVDDKVSAVESFETAPFENVTSVVSGNENVEPAGANVGTLTQENVAGDNASSTHSAEPTAHWIEASAVDDQKDEKPALSSVGLMKKDIVADEEASTTEYNEPTSVLLHKNMEAAAGYREPSEEESAGAQTSGSQESTLVMEQKDLEPTAPDRTLSKENSVAFEVGSTTESSPVESDRGVGPVMASEGFLQEDDEVASITESPEPVVLDDEKVTELAPVDEELFKGNSSEDEISLTAESAERKAVEDDRNVEPAVPVEDLREEESIAVDRALTTEAPESTAVEKGESLSPLTAEELTGEESVANVTNLTEESADNNEVINEPNLEGEYVDNNEVINEENVEPASVNKEHFEGEQNVANETNFIEESGDTNAVINETNLTGESADNNEVINEDTVEPPNVRKEPFQGKGVENDVGMSSKSPEAISVAQDIDVKPRAWDEDVTKEEAMMDDIALSAESAEATTGEADRDVEPAKVHEEFTKEDSMLGERLLEVEPGKDNPIVDEELLEPAKADDGAFSKEENLADEIPAGATVVVEEPHEEPATAGACHVEPTRKEFVPDEMESSPVSMETISTEHATDDEKQSVIPDGKAFRTESAEASSSVDSQDLDSATVHEALTKEVSMPSETASAIHSSIQKGDDLRHAASSEWQLENDTAKDEMASTVESSVGPPILDVVDSTKESAGAPAVVEFRLEDLSKEESLGNELAVNRESGGPIATEDSSVSPAVGDEDLSYELTAIKEPVQGEEILSKEQVLSDETGPGESTALVEDRDVLHVAPKYGLSDEETLASTIESESAEARAVGEDEGVEPASVKEDFPREEIFADELASTAASANAVPAVEPVSAEEEQSEETLAEDEASTTESIVDTSAIENEDGKPVLAKYGIPVGEEKDFEPDPMTEDFLKEESVPDEMTADSVQTIPDAPSARELPEGAFSVDAKDGETAELEEDLSKEERVNQIASRTQSGDTTRTLVEDEDAKPLEAKGCTFTKESAENKTLSILEDKEPQEVLLNETNSHKTEGPQETTACQLGTNEGADETALHPLDEPSPHMTFNSKPVVEAFEAEPYGEVSSAEKHFKEESMGYEDKSVEPTISSKEAESGQDLSSQANCPAPACVEDGQTKIASAVINGDVQPAKAEEMLSKSATVVDDDAKPSQTEEGLYMDTKAVEEDKDIVLSPADQEIVADDEGSLTEATEGTTLLNDKNVEPTTLNKEFSMERAAKETVGETEAAVGIADGEHKDLEPAITNEDSSMGSVAEKRDATMEAAEEGNIVESEGLGAAIGNKEMPMESLAEEKAATANAAEAMASVDHKNVVPTYASRDFSVESAAEEEPTLTKLAGATAVPDKKDGVPITASLAGVEGLWTEDAAATAVYEDVAPSGTTKKFSVEGMAEGELAATEAAEAITMVNDFGPATPNNEETKDTADAADATNVLGNEYVDPPIASKVFSRESSGEDKAMTKGTLVTIPTADDATKELSLQSLAEMKGATTMTTGTLGVDSVSVGPTTHNEQLLVEAIPEEKGSKTLAPESIDGKDLEHPTASQEFYVESAGEDRADATDTAETMAVDSKDVEPANTEKEFVVESGADKNTSATQAAEAAGILIATEDAQEDQSSVPLSTHTSDVSSSWISGSSTGPSDVQSRAGDSSVSFSQRSQQSLPAELSLGKDDWRIVSEHSLSPSGAFSSQITSTSRVDLYTAGLRQWVEWDEISILYGPVVLAIMFISLWWPLIAVVICGGLSSQMLVCQQLKRCENLGIYRLEEAEGSAVPCQ